MTATEVSRNFSEVSNRVASGEEVTVTRGGRPLLVMRPAVPEAREWIPGREFLEMLGRIPPLDGGFAADVEAYRKSMDERPERATPIEWD